MPVETNYPSLSLTRRKALWVKLEAVLPGILDDFYAHYTQHPHLKEILSGKNIEGLKKAQTEHWKKACTEDMGANYDARCKRIGLAHARIGLTPADYCVAYGYIYSSAHRIFTQGIWKNWLSERWRTERLEALETLTRLINVDMASSIDAYFVALQEESSTRINHICSEVLSATQGTSLQVQESTSAIQATVTEVNLAGESLKELVQKTQEISGVLKLIREIAEQTNMLALNANIEAARAGTAGKGFGVVASEVKRLAGSVEDATRQIETQTKNITKAAKATEGAMVSISGQVGVLNDNICNAQATFLEQETALQEILGSTVKTAA